MMTPYLVDRIEDAYGRVVKQNKPTVIDKLMTSDEDSNNPKQKKNRCTGNPSGFIGSGKGTLLDGRLADP